MLTIALTFLLATPDDLPAGWMKGNFTPNGFAITMPIPKRQSFEDTGPDDKPVHIQIYRGKVGEVSYIVSVSNFSLSYISQPVKVIFDNARDGSLARSGGTLVSEKDIQLGTTTGRETMVKAKDAGFVRARVYVYNQRQYSLTITSPQEADLDTADARRFFESFVLKPIKKTGK